MTLSKEEININSAYGKRMSDSKRESDDMTLWLLRNSNSSQWGQNNTLRLDSFWNYRSMEGEESVLVNETLGLCLRYADVWIEGVRRYKQCDEVFDPLNVTRIGDKPNETEPKNTHTYPNRHEARNKYDREILPGLYVDVYDILDCFKLDSSRLDHAAKKLLAPGQRGHKDRLQDLKEVIASVQSEIDIMELRGEK